MYNSQMGIYITYAYGRVSTKIWKIYFIFLRGEIQLLKKKSFMYVENRPTVLTYIVT